MKDNIFDEAQQKLDDLFDSWDKDKNQEPIETIEKAIELGKLYEELFNKLELKVDIYDGDSFIGELDKIVVNSNLHFKDHIEFGNDEIPYEIEILLKKIKELKND